MANKRQPLYKSILLALRGIILAIKSERNLKIHLVAGLTVIIFGKLLQIDIYQWLILLLVVFAVIAAEIFNSSLEEYGNILNRKLRLEYPETRLARDYAAGAVMVLAIGAVIIGLIIFCS